MMNLQKELDSYIGKEYGTDFIREDLEVQYPDYDIFVANKNALALANFRPDRIRVWLDDDNKVVNIVTG